MKVECPKKVAKRKGKSRPCELSRKSHPDLEVGGRFEAELASLQKRLRGYVARSEQLIAVQLELMTAELPKEVLRLHWSQDTR